MTLRTELLIAALVISMAAVVARAQEPSSLRTITIHSDDVASSSPPRTLGERLGLVDAVVRGDRQPLFNRLGPWLWTTFGS